MKAFYLFLVFILPLQSWAVTEQEQQEYLIYGDIMYAINAAKKGVTIDYRFKDDYPQETSSPLTFVEYYGLTSDMKICQLLKNPDNVKESYSLPELRDDNTYFRSANQSIGSAVCEKADGTFVTLVVFKNISGDTLEDVLSKEKIWSQRAEFVVVTYEAKGFIQ